MRLHIRHDTVYRYRHPVEHSTQVLRLTPRRDPWQSTVRWSLSCPGRRLEQLDAFGNITHLVSIDEPLSELHIGVRGIVDTGDAEGHVPTDETGLSPLAFLGETRLTRPDEAIRALAARLGGTPSDAAALLDVAAVIQRAIAWEPGVTEVDHDAAQALALGRGVCQDHAHVFCSVCRVLGVPTRYVSGYHCGSGEVGSASHAWADAWLGPELGWYSVDITHGCLAGPRHCRLAVGRDYLDAAPVRGVRRGGGDEKLSVEVLVAESGTQ